MVIFMECQEIEGMHKQKKKKKKTVGYYFMQALHDVRIPVVTPN